jgi:hypothetical protein
MYHLELKLHDKIALNKLMIFKWEIYLNKNTEFTKFLKVTYEWLIFGKPKAVCDLPILSNDDTSHE